MATIVAAQSEDTTTKTKHTFDAGMGSAEQRLKAKDLPNISQKSLFLALYAKVMSGEKRKDEDAEMVMGPHDQGSPLNKQLRSVSAYLRQWFSEVENDEGEFPRSQGWLEYL